MSEDRTLSVRKKIEGKATIRRNSFISELSLLFREHNHGKEKHNVLFTVEDIHVPKILGSLPPKILGANDPKKKDHLEKCKKELQGLLQEMVAGFAVVVVVTVI